MIEYSHCTVTLGCNATLHSLESSSSAPHLNHALHQDFLRASQGRDLWLTHLDLSVFSQILITPTLEALSALYWTVSFFRLLLSLPGPLRLPLYILAPLITVRFPLR